MSRVNSVVAAVRTLITLSIAAVLLSWPVHSRVQAADSFIDMTFGDGGKVFSTFSGTGAEGKAVAIQPDGKILLSGSTGSPSLEFAVSRYNANGSLDLSFGSSGVARAETIDSFSGVANAMALQPDGKILLAGSGTHPVAPFSSFIIVRFNADGSLDGSFGSGGIVTTKFSPRDDGINSLALEPDGKIVAAGFSNLNSQNFDADFALARYNSDGSLDSSFGVGGKVTTNFRGFTDIAEGVIIQPDGKIVAGGSASFRVAQFAGEFWDFALARYLPDGSLDPTFDGDGKVITDLFGSFDQARAVRLQPDGKIILAGAASDGSFGNDGDFALVRYNADGSLDPTFDGDGKVLTDFLTFYDEAGDIALRPDGKIVAVGQVSTSLDVFTEKDFGVALYNADGSLDASFGEMGKITTDIGSLDVAVGVGLQADGKIIAVGATTISDKRRLVAVRYRLDGNSFDLCLQDNGNNSTLKIDSATGDYLFTNCKGFSIGGAGSLTKKGGTYTLQHNASDRRITAKIDTSAKKGSATVTVLSTGVMFSITDKNTANNTCACQ